MHEANSDHPGNFDVVSLVFVCEPSRGLLLRKPHCTNTSSTVDDLMHSALAQKQAGSEELSSPKPGAAGVRPDRV